MRSVSHSRISWWFAYLWVVGCGGTTPPPAAPVVVASVAPLPPPARRPLPSVETEVGALDADAVERTFETLMGPIERCQDERRGQDRRLSFLSGDVKIEVRVKADGSVRYAFLSHSTLGDRTVENCIVAAVKAAQWPKPEGGEGIAKNEFQLPLKADRDAIVWDSAKVTPQLASAKGALHSCRRKTKGAFEITAYVDRRGTVISAGAAQPDGSADAAADCLAKTVTKFRRLPSPGDWPAKVTFPLPLFCRAICRGTVHNGCVLLRRWLTTPLPLVPLAPMVVVLLGMAATAVMIQLSLGHVRQINHEAALERADLLAEHFATRIRAVAPEQRPWILAEAARLSQNEVLLVSQQGAVLVPANVGISPAWLRSLLATAHGVTNASTGSAAFAARQLEAPYAHLVLLVFVAVPRSPPAGLRLVTSVILLSTLLIGLTSFVAYRFSKQAQGDVDFVRRRIEQMAAQPGSHAGAIVPMRAFDQVGVVTAAFNVLVGRFVTAEQAYQHDLSRTDALDRSRARFLAALSHELRTPLNGILGFADVLLSEVEGPLTPSAREDLGIVRSSGLHLRALIDDVIDLSAMEAGNLRLERSPVDVYAVTAEIMREMGPLLAGRDVRFALTGERDVVAHLDRRRLRQIVANLIGNAVKFTTQGTIDVRVGRNATHVVIEVVDTGPGIPQPDRISIFEEYSQSGDVQSRRQGTGLGLAIARRLTRMHAGKLSVESEVGRGSTFRLELPLHQKQAAGNAEVPQKKS